MKNLMMIMYFVVSIMLMCCVQHGKSFFHLTPNKQHPAPPRFAVSTHKPARSYQVDTMVNQDQDSVTSSFSNLQNLKKSKGMGDANQLPELERLSESDLLNKSPTMDAMARTDQALSLAYDRCEYVTNLFSKTFYMGTSLMRPDARKHVWAIYAWCRRTDDIVDSPRALMNKEVLETDLEVWNNRLADIWKDHPVDLFDLAMADTVKKYPGIDVQPYRDMIAGMVMDVPGLGQERYQNFDELYTYCYRVAGTVGLMTLPVLGTAEGVTQEEATPSALALGIALQLTNILRDVGEDLERGRIYLPLDEIARFGLTEEDLFKCEVTPKYVEFMKFQIQRARDYYKKARRYTYACP